MPIQNDDPRSIISAVRTLLHEETINKDRYGSAGEYKLVWCWDRTFNPPGTRISIIPKIDSIPEGIARARAQDLRIANYGAPIFVRNDEGTGREVILSSMFDAIARSTYMDPTDNKDEEQKNAGGIPVLRINRRKRWNLNVRLRRSTDPGAQPIYTTVTIYPASQVLDAKGQEISESDPDYESVYVEFGPNGMNQLTKMAAADPHLELDLLIPTLDEAISVYGGRMIQRKPGVRGNQNVWIWDLDVSHDLRELVYGREVEDLRPDTLDASVADDPLLAVLRRGRPAS